MARPVRFLIAAGAVLLAAAVSGRVDAATEVDLSVAGSLNDGTGRPTLSLGVATEHELGRGWWLRAHPVLRWDNDQIVADDFDHDAGLNFLNESREQRGPLGGTVGLRYLGERFEGGLVIDEIDSGAVFELEPTKRLGARDFLDLPFVEDLEIPALYAATYFADASLRFYFLPVDNVSYVGFRDARVDLPYALVDVGTQTRVDRDVPTASAEHFQGAAVFEMGTGGLTFGRAFDNLPVPQPESPTRIRARYDPYVYGGGWYSFVFGRAAARAEAAMISYDSGHRSDRVDYAVQVDYRPTPSSIVLIEYLGQELNEDEHFDTGLLQRAFHNSMVVHGEYRYRRVLTAELTGFWRFEEEDGALRAEVNYDIRDDVALRLRGGIFFGREDRLLGQFRDEPMIELQVRVGLPI